MFTFIDKSLISGLVTFLSAQAANWWGYEIPVEVQAAMVTLVMFFVYLIPNKAKK